MKIITVAIILAVVAIDANAAWGPKYGSEDSCIVERKNGRKFYFCGQSQSECAGYKVLKWSTQKAFQNEKSFTSEFDSSRTFYCCNPDGGARGVWKEGKSWYVTDEVATKQLEHAIITDASTYVGATKVQTVPSQIHAQMEHLCAMTNVLQTVPTAFYDCCKMLSMSESERTNMENYEQIVNDCQIRQ